MASSNNRRNSTTPSIASEASFQTDEDGSECGHLSVSVSELNQLRQHVRSMRTNMTSRNSKQIKGSASTDGSHVSVLEEVDLATGRSQAGSSAPAGLMVSDIVMTPEQKKRVFRMAIVGNIMFVLGALLYVCVAHGDLEWAKTVQGVPVNVLQADDDATWRSWEAQSSSPSRSGRNAGRRSLQVQEQPRKLLKTPRKLQMQTDEDQDYNDASWVDLPYSIQLALMVLGHNQHTWDNAMTSSIEETRWNKLSREEQEAALVIGYTSEEWDSALDEEEKMWEASEQAYFATTDGDDDRYRDDDQQDDRFEDDDKEDDRFEDDQVDDRVDDDQVDDRFEDDQVDDRIQDDDQEDGRFEDDQVDDRFQDDDQQDDQVDDRFEDDDQEDDRFEDDQVDDAVDDMYADDDQQGDDKVLTAGEVFDWYEQSTGDDIYPENANTGGGQNSNQNGAGAQINGAHLTSRPTAPPATAAPQQHYTIDGDLIPSSTSTYDAAQRQQVTAAPEVPKNIQSPEDLMIWGDYDWETLPNAVQKAFEILGYNEELWNTGGTAFTEDLYWNDLTPAQQQQAMVLGYNQALWDEAEDGRYDIVTGEQDDEYASDDADDDEYIRVGDMDIETSAVTLFFAALCFMIAGVMSWIRERQVFHMWMVQGGVFGVLSALTMGFSDFASLLLQTVSVHCFLLHSFFMIRLRKTIRPIEGLEQLGQALWVADILFFAGSFVQVIMVYWMHMDEDAYYDISLARGEVFSSWCWFITACIYTMNTMALQNKTLGEDQDSRTLTITRRHPNGEAYTIRPAAIQLRNQPPQHDVVLT